jgi:hypothetical protein
MGWEWSGEEGVLLIQLTDLPAQGSVTTLLFYPFVAAYVMRIKL